MSRKKKDMSQEQRMIHLPNPMHLDASKEVECSKTRRSIPEKARTGLIHEILWIDWFFFRQRKRQSVKQTVLISFRGRMQFEDIHPHLRYWSNSYDILCQ